jgi:malate synthase
MGIEVTGPVIEGGDEILTPEALEFIAGLQRSFGATRNELIARRAVRRAEVQRTGKLDFLPETAHIRGGAWAVAPAPPALVDRRVEITGPTDRRMTINAMNSGANIWLADFEDANTPHWRNVIGGQINLRDAIRGDISFDRGDGRVYQLNDGPLATIIVRPRGWHFDERHIIVDGTPVVAALVDFGLYFFHNAQALLDQGKGPYFYLPKMESHLEARLWNDVFTAAEAALGITHGTIRATVLIETIPAAFEMEEILYELRDHASGLNAGRWDYLFSIIKYFRDSGPEYVLPDRSAITMNSPFMRSYTEQLVRACHRHGAFAIGGMAAFIPSRRDAEVNERALSAVRSDKTREVTDGFDGSWVAHPDLVAICKEVFDGVLGAAPNQLNRQREEVVPDAASLIDLSGVSGSVTEAGLRANIDVALRYLAAWLGGLGAVGIHNLMEDAATAEISRSQIWQWVHGSVVLADSGATTDEALVRKLMDDQLDAIKAEVGDEAFADGHYEQARTLFERVALDDDFALFLTLPALDLID